jgi:acetoin utilization deacetylase AcuC-like enzyme
MPPPLHAPPPASSAARPASSPLGRTWRRLARGWRRPRLDLVWSPRYRVELTGVDALRGERILAFLDDAGLLSRQAVHDPPAASFRDLRRVHADSYLESLGRAEALLPIVGLPLPDAAIERLLDAQRTMVGGTALAARLALAGGGIACNLGGGLHHAFRARGERFCLFNDVAVAIAQLRAGGFAAPVLVVDLDLHDGDGTRAIFAGDESVHTFSIHNRTSAGGGGGAAAAGGGGGTIDGTGGGAGGGAAAGGGTAPDAGGGAAAGGGTAPAAGGEAASTAIELGDAVEDAAYLATLERELPPVFARVKPGLVFYLAGCDPAADDALGNWKISAAGMLERDRRVAAWARPARERPAPLVIALAGGYGRQAWRYSARFLSALLNRGRAIEPPGTSAMTLRHYRRLTAGLAAGELSGAPGGDDWGLTHEDVQEALGGVQRPPRLLGFYSRQGLEFALERAGLLDRLRSLGFEHPDLDLDLDNPAGDMARLWSGPDRRELLAELRVRIDRRTLEGMAMLRVEWLRLQNPRSSFAPSRPRLPGQEHPGLGMLRDTIALLILACERLQLDGILFVPAHYHTAVQSRRSLRFLEPEVEGRFRALERALRHLPLAAAAHAVEAGQVVEAATGQPFVWLPGPMVIPVSPALRGRLEGEVYEAAAAREDAAHQLAVIAGPQPSPK